jgi:hypothetical protein
MRSLSVAFVIPWLPIRGLDPGLWVYWGSSISRAALHGAGWFTTWRLQGRCQRMRHIFDGGDRPGCPGQGFAAEFCEFVDAMWWLAGPFELGRWIES